MAGGMANVYFDDGGTGTWYTWATADCTSTASDTTTVWATWVVGGTSGITTTDLTWTTWATTGTVDSSAYQPIQLTPEQLEEQERRREEQRQRDEEARREREAAVARAEELLIAHLDEAQRNEYAREQSFRLIKGDKTYLIRRGRAGNVYLLDEDGKRSIEYCAHVVDQIPDEDNLLAQKFMIETDEAEFLRLANARRVAA